VDHYEVKVDNGSFSTQTGPYQLPPQSDSTHQVTVRAYDKAGNYRDGNVNVYIDATNPLSPTNPHWDDGATSNDTTIIADWDDATDTSGINDYYLQVDTDNTFDAPLTWEGWAGSSSNKTLTSAQGITNGNTYYFRVKSKNGSGLESPYSLSSAEVTINAPLTYTFYFAEGTTQPGFDEFLCIQNPQTTLANITITYMPEGSSPFTRTLQVPASSRKTIHVNKYDPVNNPGGAGPGYGGLSCKVDSDTPIITERPMYFNLPTINLVGGHNVMGYSLP
jgi:hypothetical protein